MIKLKILVVNTVEFVIGGISTVIMNYYENMNKADMQIDFVINNRIEEVYSDIIKDSNSKMYILDRNKNPFKYMMQLRRIIKENKYDIVHVHGNSSTMTVDLLPAYLCGVKVRIAHSHNTSCSHVFFHKVLSPLFKLTYTNALACSKDAGNWIFGENKFEVLPNGIHADRYVFSERVRNEVRSEFHLDGKFVIGHVGFMNEQKNHAMIFKVFAKVKEIIPEAFLVCVTGSDEIPEELQQLIHEYNLEGSILTLFKRKDVNRLLQAMDVFVFPSKWEGLGIALIEAQATGLQCIASDQVAREANVSGQINFLSLTETRDWIEAIESIYKNNSQSVLKRIELCKETHLKIKQAGYDVKSNAKIIHDMYEQYCWNR